MIGGNADSDPDARNQNIQDSDFGDPVCDGGGWGAWELAARFSDLDFNDNAGVAGKAIPTGGLRGGDQKIWTLGINWYPVSAVKIEAQYQAIDINRLGTKGTVTNTQVGQNLSTFALRTQISF